MKKELLTQQLKELVALQQQLPFNHELELQIQIIRYKLSMLS